MVMQYERLDQVIRDALDVMDKARWKGMRSVLAEMPALIARLKRQRTFRGGYDDRQDGYGARSADGAYLNGYYSDDGGLYYVTMQDIDRVAARADYVDQFVR